MNKRLSRAQNCSVVAAMLVLFSPLASAYVGPGAGLGLLGAALAMLAAIVVTVVGLVMWPLRVLRRRKKVQAEAADPKPKNTG